MQEFTNSLALPWTEVGNENKRFKLILFALFAVTLLVFIWIPLIELPEPDREELEELPPQLAKLIAQKKPEPKPVIPAPKVEAPTPEKPKPEPKKVEPKPVPKTEPPALKKPDVKPPKNKLVKEAREVAKKTGLLALQSELSELSAVVDMTSLSSAPSEALKQAKTTDRDILNKQAVLGKSGGVSDVAPVTTKQVQLASVDTTTLEETDDERALAVAEAEAALGERQRSRDSIRLGLEKLKSSFNKLYQRELRNDPFLAGRVELEFVVESSGEVSYCRVASSGLNNSALESKLCNRLKLADFGAENVARATELQSFNFEPN